MPYLVAAVVLVGALGLVNLVLTLAVIRRLREFAARDSARRGRPREDLLRPVGSVIDVFAANDVDGAPVTSDGLADRLLVGFFSPGCGPCHEQLPAFRTLAADLPGGRDRALAVVVGAGGEAAAVAAELSADARVVVEALGGPLSSAFAVSGFPTFYVLDTDRRVAAAGLSVAAIGAALPSPSTASA